jgi:5'-deoxynucleotidase YfbR-like HD superfamily hydrolase
MTLRARRNGGTYRLAAAADFPAPMDVSRDVDAMLESIRASEMFRFYHQKFWEEESRSADAATGDRALETIAAHSWGVADAVLLLQPYFSYLDGYLCLRLAILHDKPELITGDIDPLGVDGTGQDTHAFNSERQKDKAEIDRRAAIQYASSLRPQIGNSQLADLLLFIEGATPEARFVKAVDKLQALAYVVVKKSHGLLPPHFDFTRRFSAKALAYFPLLKSHYEELVRRLVERQPNA